MSNRFIPDNLVEEPRRKSGISVAARIVLGLLFFTAVGTMLLMLPAVTIGDRLSLIDALFIATSAVTVSGLSVIDLAHEFTPLGQIILLGLIQIGGVGYMFVAALAMRLVGRRVPLLDRLALSNSLGLDKPTAILQILQRVFWGILLVEGVGAVLLYWHWRVNDIVPAENGVLYAIFHAISAFCNAGFDLFANLPASFPPDNTTTLIISMLVIIGGLGIPVLTDCLTYRQQRRFSLHTRLTLMMMGSLIFVGWAGLWLSETRSGGVLQDTSYGQQLIDTLYQSIVIRTAGFAGLPNFEEISPASQWLITALMFVGGAPALMGGGITTGTFAVLILSLWAYARGLPVAQVGGRTISAGTVRRAGAVLTLSITLVILATWLLLLTHDTTVNEALFEVVSAFATCGLSLGLTADLNVFGRFVLMIVMFWGRLGALTIVIAIAQRSTQQQLVRFPEEIVLIG